MKKLLVLILPIFIMSCKGRNERMLYINHITEVRIL